MNNGSNRVAHLAVALLLAGCASSSPPVTPESAKDAIELARKVSVQQARSGKDTEGALGGMFQGMKAAASSPKDAGTYLQGEQWWCQPKGMADPWGATRESFKAHCAQRQGVYDNGFCSKSADHDQVLFVARVIRRTDACAQVAVLTIEPKGSLDDPAYRARLLELGFVPTAKLEAQLQESKRKAAIAGEAMRAEGDAQERRYYAELPAMRRIGAKVCRTEQANTFVGFVENVTDDKLQIRVAQAYVTRTPSVRYGDFRPQIIWDYPERWRLCD